MKPLAVGHDTEYDSRRNETSHAAIFYLFCRFLFPGTYLSPYFPDTGLGYDVNILLRK